MILTNNTAKLFKGKWIVVEGPDRIGKSTLIKNIARCLTDSGLNVTTNAFPRRGTQIGSLISKSMRNEADGEYLSGKAQTLLFLADMANAGASIVKSLAQGNVVITDRFTMSTYAYALAQYPEITAPWIKSAVSLIPVPDVNVILLPYDDDITFLTKRDGFGGEKTEKEEIQKQVLKHMRLYALEHESRCLPVTVARDSKADVIYERMVMPALVDWFRGHTCIPHPLGSNPG